MNPPGTPASLLPSLPPQARILIVRLRSIGDIVLLTPALHLLKKWRPDLRVSVLIEDRFRTEQLLIPRYASIETADRQRDVRNCRELCHSAPPSTREINGENYPVIRFRPGKRAESATAYRNPYLHGDAERCRTRFREGTQRFGA